MWQRACVLSLYLLLLFGVFRLWDWYSYGLSSAPAMMDPNRLNIKKLRAILEQRGLMHLDVFEKHEWAQMIFASGRITQDEVRESKDEPKFSSDKTLEEITSHDSTIFTGPEHFNELVEDCKDSVWIVQVIGVMDQLSINDKIWAQLEHHFSPFGVRFGIYDCRAGSRCVRYCTHKLRHCHKKKEDRVKWRQSSFDADAGIDENLDNFPLLLALFIVFLYTFGCAALFQMWETQWDYFTAFYFFFVSLTTIGLGDEVPANPHYATAAFCFFIVGLALVSMCVSVMHARLESKYMAALQLIEQEYLETEGSPILNLALPSPHPTSLPVSVRSSIEGGSFHRPAVLGVLKGMHNLAEKRRSMAAAEGEEEMVNLGAERPETIIEVISSPSEDSQYQHF